MSCIKLTGTSDLNVGMTGLLWSQSWELVWTPLLWTSGVAMKIHPWWVYVSERPYCSAKSDSLDQLGGLVLASLSLLSSIPKRRSLGPCLSMVYLHRGFRAKGSIVCIVSLAFLPIQFWIWFFGTQCWIFQGPLSKVSWVVFEKNDKIGKIDLFCERCFREEFDMSHLFAFASSPEHPVSHCLVAPSHGCRISCGDGRPLCLVNN